MSTEPIKYCACQNLLSITYSYSSSHITVGKLLHFVTKRHWSTDRNALSDYVHTPAISY